MIQFERLRGSRGFRAHDRGDGGKSCGELNQWASFLTPAWLKICCSIMMLHLVALLAVHHFFVTLQNNQNIKT